VVVRRSVSFTEDSLKMIQRWRVEHSTETAMIDFSEAVNQLINK
jgi:hypothetical protein